MEPGSAEALPACGEQELNGPRLCGRAIRGHNAQDRWLPPRRPPPSDRVSRLSRNGPYGTDLWPCDDPRPHDECASAISTRFPMRTLLGVFLAGSVLFAQCNPDEPILAGVLDPFAAAQLLLPVHGFSATQLAVFPRA